MSVDITDEFLELVKKCPSDMTRTEYSFRKPYTGTRYNSHYEVEMIWVVNKTTIKIRLRDSGSFSDSGNATLSLMHITLSKKKWYNFFTSETTIHHSDVHTDHVNKLYDAIKEHYFGHTEWSPRGTDSISNYL